MDPTNSVESIGKSMDMLDGFVSLSTSIVHLYKRHSFSPEG